jgi:hypothetical protein
LVAKPRINLLQVERAALLERVGGVDDPYTRVLDRQAGQVSRHIERVVERVARPLRLLATEPKEMAEIG